MTGVGTVLTDDPLLTCRLEETGRDPVRIICDSSLRTPLTAKIVTTARETPTILATCCRDKEKQAPYIAAGCRILECGAGPRVDLKDLTAQLGAAGIDSILLEGGSTLAWSALESGIVQKVQAYIAPKIFGGATSKTPVGGTGFPAPDQALRLNNMTVTQLGQDLLLEGDIEGKEDPERCSQD